MNNINLVGRLVKDPEVRTAGDKNITSFRLAVDRKFGGKTDFFTCNAWNDNYICQYAKKGTIVSLNGEVQFSEKEGRYYTTVVVDHSKIVAEGIKKDEVKSSIDSFEEFEDFDDADIKGLFSN